LQTSKTVKTVKQQHQKQLQLLKTAENNNIKNSYNSRMYLNVLDHFLLYVLDQNCCRWCGRLSRAEVVVVAGGRGCSGVCWSVLDCCGTLWGPR